MSLLSPIYPHVSVKLSNTNGNAFAILGTVRRAMANAKLSGDQIQQFMEEATSGDYDNLLRTITKYVEVT